MNTRILRGFLNKVSEIPFGCIKKVSKIDHIVMPSTNADKGLMQSLSISSIINKSILNIKKSVSPEVVDEIMIKQRNLLKLKDEQLRILGYVKNGYCKDNTYILEEYMPGLFARMHGSNPYSYGIETLDLLTNSSKLPKGTVLYRGAGTMDFGLDVTAEEFVNTYIKKGKTSEIPVFLSTSTDGSVARSFLKPNGQYGNNKFLLKLNYPNGGNGVSLENLSSVTKEVADRNEHEILTPRNLKVNWQNITKEIDPETNLSYYTLEGNVL